MCEQNGFSVVLRSLLSLRPELSPSSLAKLNWEARRVAVLCSVPPPTQGGLMRRKDNINISGKDVVTKPFTLVSSASSTFRSSSNIVTNSLTDDLNIMTENKVNDPLGSGSSASSCSGVDPLRDRGDKGFTSQRERQQDTEQYHDDIDWLLNDRKCASLQAFYATIYKSEPKLWRRVLMYL